MEIIAFASGKGGTGKTLMASCLGYSLTRAGHRVLMVDGDPATDGLSLFLLGRDGTQHIGSFEELNTFSGILRHFAEGGKISFEPRRINRTESNESGGHGISYQAVISSKALYGDEQLLTKRLAVPDLEQEVFEKAVRLFFQELRESRAYDYVIVDTGGVRI
ncbi:MAG: ParA family protein [Candidatus Acidiferrales bacterium]|jgi:cellulose biosynthesis protein BcsQ